MYPLAKPRNKTKYARANNAKRRSTGKTNAQKPTKKHTTYAKRAKGNSFSSNDEAQFSLNKTDNDQNFKRVDKLKKGGWINDSLEMGVLTNIIDGENRVVFEFELDNIKYDAWSVKGRDTCNYAAQNFKLLEIGHEFVLEGTIMAKFIDAKERKYWPSSNSNFEFHVRLSDVTVVRKEKYKGVIMNKNLSETFERVNGLIESGSSFNNETIKEVEISDGDVRRYIGCEDCFAGISNPDRNGKYSCKLCKKRKRGKNAKKEGRGCIIVRNLKLKDKDGGILENVVCFQKACYPLFGGKTEVDKLCESPSDMDARNRFGNMIGAKINITINGQKPTTRRQNPYNEYKVIVQSLVIVDPCKASRAGSNERNVNTGQSNLVLRRNDPVAKNKLCDCHYDENDGDTDNDDDGTASNSSVDSGTDAESMDWSPTDTNRQTPVLTQSSNNFYRLTPNEDNHIGLAMVINISKGRQGSKEDVKSLRKLFPELSIRIFTDKPLINITKKEFDTKLIEFKKKLVGGKYQSLVFVLMGHGTLYNVRLADDSRLNVYTDILANFGEREFPEFKEKPKLFIFNACQNFPVFKDKDSQANYSIDWQVDDSQRILHLLECYPCSPGVKAKRCTENGSYFIQTLVKVFRKYWQKMHVEEMMKVVQEKMSNMHLGEDGQSYNIPIYKPVVFSKCFYFGIRDSTTVDDIMEDIENIDMPAE